MQKIPFNFGWERTSEEHLFWREPEDLVMVDLPDDCVLELPRGLWAARESALCRTASQLI